MFTHKLFNEGFFINVGPLIQEGYLCFMGICNSFIAFAFISLWDSDGGLHVGLHVFYSAGPISMHHDNCHRNSLFLFVWFFGNVRHVGVFWVVSKAAVNCRKLKENSEVFCLLFKITRAAVKHTPLIKRWISLPPTVFSFSAYKFYNLAFFLNAASSCADSLRSSVGNSRAGC